MSLLLQALQKAARNREAASTEPDGDAKPPELEFGLDSAQAEQRAEPHTEALALADEEIFEPDIEPSLPEIDTEPALRGSHGNLGIDASSAHAATILRASEPRGQSWLDRVRDRPVHTFAILSGIFAMFYGAYVYLQIFHPALLRGDFLSKPLQATAPSSPPPMIPPQPVAPIATSAPPTPSAPTAVAGTGAASTASATTKSGPAPATSAPGEKGADLQPRAEPAPRAAESRAAAPARVRETAPRRPITVAEAEVGLEDHVSVRTPEVRPTPVTTGLMDAWQALQQGRVEQAESLYQSALQAEPQNVDAVLGLAAISARQGRTEQAIRYYERALELEPRNPTAQAGLISIVGQADPQLSETRLKQLIANEPSGYLYFSLGNLYARQARWPQAQQAYFQAYQLQPDHPDYAYNLAIGLEHLNQPRIALSYYRKALELSNLRGNASFDQSRVQERITQLAARVGGE
jgi:Flp pilus assembly protein TadD